ncbi:hypothetical protein [Streptomyces sp.]|uniref:hypothetical protein n=1 Tax=Streptomyces sp. TaxID=1931 RepID=UPI0028126CDB|nr:hypothetical protein [Streptomyces sp.]
MMQRRDGLTELVQQHVGKHTDPEKMSVKEFCERAIDPDTGYQPSNGLIGKIVSGGSFGVTAQIPQLVGAIAAGLGLPREIVAAAAHLQLIGYEESELEGGAPAALLRRLDAEPGEPERRVAEKWATETDQ